MAVFIPLGHPIKIEKLNGMTPEEIDRYAGEIDKVMAFAFPAPKGPQTGECTEVRRRPAWPDLQRVLDRALWLDNRSDR